ncbi:hypothetical protein [Actinoallomurus bryophytorum]|uniref:hypothetical protein n=1 Tax=Actinoallomurus bryophytorum TaxID=1490222 RepID=UPI0011511782|nr:hypothetical protein [Actinoallomurus bryophytorum]
MRLGESVGLRYRADDRRGWREAAATRSLSAAAFGRANAARHHDEPPATGGHALIDEDGYDDLCRGDPAPNPNLER